MRKVALSTSDNPYNPFEQFDEWCSYDAQMGYYSSSLIARIATVSEGIGVVQNQKIKEAAIDRIIETIPVNSPKPNVVYIKVFSE